MLLRDYLAAGSPLTDGGTVYVDLMSCALERVDWLELARSLLEGAGS